MSGNVSSRKRLIAITPGNLRNNHIYISGHHDFFPPEVYGQSSGRKSKAKSVTLQVEGLPEPITTDIAVNRSNGRPRNFFRKRAWVGRFFKKHEIREGDVVAVERLDAFNYRIYPFESKNVREGSAIPDHWPPPDPTKPTAIDLYAGCGGFAVRLKHTA